MLNISLRIVLLLPILILASSSFGMLSQETTQKPTLQHNNLPQLKPALNNLSNNIQSKHIEPQKQHANIINTSIIEHCKISLISAGMVMIPLILMQIAKFDIWDWEDADMRRFRVIYGALGLGVILAANVIGYGK